MSGLDATVAALAEDLAARGAEIEAHRTLPDDLVSAFKKHGLFRMVMPKGLGGLGLPPRRVVEIVEEISYADAATGWSLLIGNIGNAFLAWLDPAVAEKLVADQPDILVAGGQAPLGQGTLEPDGRHYRLSGRWPFASGCLHSSWYMGGFIVMEDGRPKTDARGGPEMRVAYFPASAARTVDTWHVAGLRGTGSHDIVADGVRVPVEHTSVPYFGPARHDDPVYRLTAYNLLLTCLAGFPLGVGRRALDEADRQLRTKRRIGSDQPQIHDPLFQTELMARGTELDAARRQVLGTLDELLDELAAGDPGYPRRARLAASVLHALDTGRAAAMTGFRLCGAAALHDDNPVQRCMRDLVAGAQHVAFSADSRKRIAGALLGLQTTPLFFGV
ncbi:acyl-CoA dehydrogenase family protein [Streptomyces eurythermus]